MPLARQLCLALDYALSIKAGVSLGYRLAGDFSLITRQGSEAGWLRLTVHKNRESEFNFAADFGVTGKVDLNGLPDSPDEFLGALLGTDVKTFLGYFSKVEKYSSLDELEKAVGKLAKGFVHDLSQKWINKVLDNSTLKEFLAEAHKVVEAYKNIDQRIIDLYADYLDKLPQFDATLNLLLGLGSRADLTGASAHPLHDGAASRCSDSAPAA